MDLGSIARAITKATARATDPFLIARAPYFLNPQRSLEPNDISGDVVSFLSPVLTSIIPKSEPALVGLVANELIRYIKPLSMSIEMFRFPYNPRSIQYTVTAHQNLTEYGNNVVVRMGWGVRTIPVSITGWVNLTPPAIVVKTLGYVDYRLSWGYMLLYLLEQWLKKNSNYVMLVIAGSRVWVGWWSDFSYSLNANLPFQADFTLRFNFHPNTGKFIGDAKGVIKMLKDLRKTGVLTNMSYGSPENWTVWSR